MLLLDWLTRQRSRKPDTCAVLADRLAGIERQLARLAEDRQHGSPLIIQHADKVVVERVAYSNHFGTLDIDSLQGQLNIGLNYRGPLKPDEPPYVPFLANASAPAPAGTPSGPPGPGPACNIRPRPAGRAPGAAASPP